MTRCSSPERDWTQVRWTGGPGRAGGLPLRLQRPDRHRPRPAGRLRQAPLTASRSRTPVRPPYPWRRRATGRSLEPARTRPWHAPLLSSRATHARGAMKVDAPRAPARAGEAAGPRDRSRGCSSRRSRARPPGPPRLPVSAAAPATPSRQCPGRPTLLRPARAPHGREPPARSSPRHAGPWPARRTSDRTRQGMHAEAQRLGVVARRGQHPCPGAHGAPPHRPHRPRAGAGARGPRPSCLPDSRPASGTHAPAEPRRGPARTLPGDSRRGLGDDGRLGRGRSPGGSEPGLAASRRPWSSSSASRSS